MTVLFSRKAEIAIKAMLYLATKEEGVCIDVRVLSAKLHVPKMFAGKILQELVYAGLLKSKKGKFGGFFLGKDGKDIRIIQIVEALDGMDMFGKCVFGFPGCSDDDPCPVHHQWGKIRSEINEMLSRLTIGDMEEETLEKIKNL